MNKGNSFPTSLVLILSLSLLLSLPSPSLAWYGSYLNRTMVTLNNNTVESMTMPLIRTQSTMYGVNDVYDGFNVTDLTFTGNNASKEIAVTDLSDNPMNFQILDYGSNWVVILPSISSRSNNNNITLYVYHNLASPSVSPFLTNTIRYFADEFNGTSLNPKWQMVSGSFSTNTISNGQWHLVSSDNFLNYIYQQQMPYPICEWSMKLGDTTHNTYVGVDNTTGSGTFGFVAIVPFSGGTKFCSLGGVYDQNCGSYDTNIHNYRVNYTSLGESYYYDNANLFNGTDGRGVPLGNFSLMQLTSGDDATFNSARCYNSTAGLNFYNSVFSFSQSSEQQMPPPPTTTTLPPTSSSVSTGVIKFLIPIAISLGAILTTFAFTGYMIEQAQTPRDKIIGVIILLIATAFILSILPSLFAIINGL